jgi:hypothetical protein
MAEYSKPFGNVGEPGCACRAARIPEEGAKRLMSLDWVLGDVCGASQIKRADGRRPGADTLIM